LREAGWNGVGLEWSLGQGVSTQPSVPFFARLVPSCLARRLATILVRFAGWKNKSMNLLEVVVTALIFPA
jgi:hypothetical protein